MMPDTLDWLPEELYPAAFRIARADECAFELAKLAAQWSYDIPLNLVQYEWDGRYAVVCESLRPVPPRISLLFSEAVNHLRASLDNVVWHLVEQEQGALGDVLGRRVALPICHDEPAFQKWCAERRKRGLTAVDGRSDVRDRLRAVQPFADTGSSIPSAREEFAAATGAMVESVHPLKLLQAYSNEDKHRIIRPTVALTSSSRSGDPILGANRSFVEVRPGDLIAEGVCGEPGEGSSTTAVMMERAAPYLATVSPVNEVGRMCTWVARVAVPRLLGRVDPAEVLPTDLALDDSGQTDEQRLAAGGFTPGLERNRPHLVEMMAEAEQRAVWAKIIEGPPPVA